MWKLSGDRSIGRTATMSIASREERASWPETLSTYFAERLS